MLIQGRTVGSKRPLFADWGVPAPPRPDSDDGGITLRELIAHVVRFEVAAFRDRQESRRLDRVLSPEQIDDGEARGKITPEARSINQRVDPEQAIAAAHHAFEDGLYLIIIDGNEHRDLDAQIFLTDDSRLTFIRLVFLAGG